MPPATAIPQIFRRLIDQSRDAIFVVEAATSKILDVNEQSCRSLGYTRDELLELRMPAIEEVYDAFGWDEQVAAARRGELDLIETGQRRKTGEVFPVEVSLGLARVDESEYVVATVRDITEKKQLEAKYLRAQRLESIGRLAGGIAHDLNNVLTPVLLATELLRGKVDDAESREFLGFIESGARRGAGMVKQILTFARGAKGERAPVRLPDLIQELLALGREAFPRSVQIKASVDPDLWLVTGDATQLHQVLMNLCVNACDAMPRGGVLEVRAENRWVDHPRPHAQTACAPGPYALVSITDNGTGIPQALQDKIFEPFFTTKGPGKGTGLGLATALGIVENHDGFISLDSRPGRTCFEVFLSAQGHAPADAPRAARRPPRPAAARTILLVEDEQAVRFVTEAVLRQHNYGVLPARDGVEAVEVFSKNRLAIDAAVVDMAMPGMDGPAAIQAISRLCPEVKILAVSGFMDAGTLAARTGRSDIRMLSKPYSSEELLREVGELLEPARAS